MCQTDKKLKHRGKTFCQKSWTDPAFPTCDVGDFPFIVDIVYAPKRFGIFVQPGLYQRDTAKCMVNAQPRTASSSALCCRLPGGWVYVCGWVGVWMDGCEWICMDILLLTRLFAQHNPAVLQKTPYYYFAAHSGNIQMQTGKKKKKSGGAATGKRHLNSYFSHSK